MIKVTTEVQRVLRSSLRIEGNHVQIMDKLERSLYVQVANVLVALGGKWSRTQGAHVFPAPPGEAIDAAIASGAVRPIRNELGFFPTPAPLAAELVAAAGVRPGSYALEPSAGTGSIVKALLDAGAHVTAVEYDRPMRLALPERVRSPSLTVSPFPDFMTADFRGMEFDFIVMNPPFTKSGQGDHIDHFRRALELLVPGGVLIAVMPSSISFRQDKRHRDFRDQLTRLSAKIAPLPDGSFKEAGTNVHTITIQVTRP